VRGRLRQLAANLSSRVTLGPLGVSSMYLLSSQAVNAVLSYGFWLLAARSLAPQVVGEVGAVLSLMSILVVLTTAGVGPTLLVELPRQSREGADRLFSAAVLLVGAASLALSVVTVSVTLVGGWWPLLSRPAVAPLVVVSVTALAVSSVFDVAALSLNRTRVLLVRTTLMAVLRLTLLAVLVTVAPQLADSPTGVAAMVALWSVALVTALAVTAQATRSAGLWFSSAGVLGATWRLVGRMGWNQAGSLAARLPPFLLPLMVTWLAGAEANAGFYLAWQLAGGCFMVSSSVVSSFTAQAGDGKDLSARSLRAARLLGVLGLPAMVATATLGPLVLGFLGETYLASRMVLLVLVVGAVPNAALSLVAARLRAERRDAAAAALHMTTMLSVLLLAWWWLPAFGVAGAAGAFAVAQVVGLSVGLVLLRPRDAARR
jgi:O-antigen/teichoic acid export membrane protein